MISTKTCSKCRIEQPIVNFSKNRCLKDGHCNWCKECTKEQHKKYYFKNREKVSAKHKEYRENNREKMKALQASWYLKNRDEIREKHRKYHREHLNERRAHSKEYNSRPEVKAHRKKYVEENREHIREYQRKYRKENHDRILEYQRKYERNNKDKVKVRHANYRKSHREQIRERSKKYRTDNAKKINKKRIARLHNDPIFKMKEQTRNMLRYVFREKGHRKTSHTADILGCDLDFFCQHMFSTWEKNYGKAWNGEPYHIDHIIPLSTAKTKEDILRLCHYTNLQMLTPDDNMTKSDRT